MLNKIWDNDAIASIINHQKDLRMLKQCLYLNANRSCNNRLLDFHVQWPNMAYNLLIFMQICQISPTPRCLLIYVCLRFCVCVTFWSYIGENQTVKKWSLKILILAIEWRLWPNFSRENVSNDNISETMRAITKCPIRLL